MLNTVSIIWCLTALAMLAFTLYQFASLESLNPISSPGSLPNLSVVIPARDEAANITRSLESVLRQEYPALEIVIVDDGSIDGTAAIAQAVADGDPRVRIIEAGALPAHWFGKPHACWVGAASASEASEWLCFIDADTQLESPLVLATTVSTAARDSLSMLTLWPFQELVTFWERAVFPTAFLLALSSINIRRINDPATDDAVGVGQFILIRRADYVALEGHSHPSVRSSVVEDVALARLVKRSGHRLRFMRADRLVSTRMYASLRELWDGFSKNVVDIFQGFGRAAVIAAGALVMGWLPVGLAVAAATSASIVAFTFWAVGMAALAATYVRVTTHLRIPIWYGLWFPVGFTLGAGIILNSARQNIMGGITWRGRRYGRRGSG